MTRRRDPDDLTAAERRRLAAGRCIVCEDPIPTTEGQVNPRRKYCIESDRCRARRYRARKRAGEVATAGEKERAAAAREVDHLLMMRGHRVRYLRNLLRQIREIDARIGDVSRGVGVEPPDLPYAREEIPRRRGDAPQALPGQLRLDDLFTQEGST